MYQNNEDNPENINRLIHDLKLPLSVLQSISDILFKLNKQDELMDYIFMMDKNIKYMTDIAKSISDVANARVEKIENNEYVDIVGYCENLVGSVRALCEMQDIDISFESDIEYLEHNTEWQHFDRIILNNIHNSIKHAKNCTLIEFILHEEDDNIIIEIKDNGIKDSEYENDISSDKRINSSSNKGLYIVSSLAEKIGANVKLHFTPDGMRFKMIMPKNEPEIMEY